MAKEIIDGKKVEKTTSSRNPIIQFDNLQIYFGRDYIIDLEGVDGTLTITQPTIGDIIDIGYERFYISLGVLVANTTSYRALLWDFGVNWNDISDFELFRSLYQGIDTDVSKLLFNGLDIKEFILCEKQLDDKQQVVLYHKDKQIEIDENVYFHISQYLRNVFQIFPEEKLTSSKMMQEWYIRKDKREQENNEKKNDKSLTNSFQAVISSCVNHPGFKYKLKELNEMGVAEFYDSVKRLQIYESTTALLKGMYSGFVDSSGIKSEDYNFMREA